MHIFNQCVLWKFSNGAENLVWASAMNSLGGTGISHYRSNESFMEGQFKVSALSFTPEHGI
jgi:hypothetical protein